MTAKLACRRALVLHAVVVVTPAGAVSLALPVDTVLGRIHILAHCRCRRWPQWWWGWVDVAHPTHPRAHAQCVSAVYQVLAVALGVVIVAEAHRVYAAAACCALRGTAAEYGGVGTLVAVNGGAVQHLTALGPGQCHLGRAGGN